MPPPPATDETAVDPVEAARKHASKQCARVSNNVAQAVAESLPANCAYVDAIADLAVRLERAEREKATVIAERDEADRRAGAAERHLAYANDTISAREQWLRDAKAAWGARDSLSFDVIWAECLSNRKALAALAARTAENK